MNTRNMTNITFFGKFEILFNINANNEELLRIFKKLFQTKRIYKKCLNGKYDKYVVETG